MTPLAREWDEILDLVMGAAWETSRWEPALKKICGFFSCSQALILIHTADGTRTRLCASWGVDAHWAKVFEERFGGSVPWLKHSRHFLRTGALVTGEEIIPEKDFLKTEFYRDFLLPQGVHHRIGMALFEQEGMVVTLTLCRPLQSGAFGEKDIANLRRLFPSLQKALRMHRHLARIDMDKCASLEALDLFPMGSFLLDGRGRILGMNRRARALVGLADGLEIDHEGLKATDYHENKLLQRMISEALAPTTIPAPARTLCRVSRPSSNPPFSFMAVPVAPKSEAPGDALVRCVVFASAPEGPEVPSEGVLRSLYGLTESEARFAAQLMRGYSVEECSLRSNISVQTGRTYLKRIFSKTGANRQGDLIRLLIHGPAQYLINAPVAEGEGIS